MASGIIISHRLKNAAAKIFVVLWIAYLIFSVYALVFFALSFDVNGWLRLSGERALSDALVLELRLVVVMLAASLMGGIIFMIRDFYQSIKYSNIYDRAYDDYRSHMMGISEFQRIVTLQVYLGRFNYTWTFWFLLQPVLSAVLGVIAYAIARSGLASVLGATGEDFSVRSIYLYVVFSFLAGFASHKFIAWLDRFADNIFKAPVPERYRETKQAVVAATAAERLDLREEVATAQAPSGISSPSETDVPGAGGVSASELSHATRPVSPAPAASAPAVSGSAVPGYAAESGYGLKSVR